MSVFDLDSRGQTAALATGDGVRADQAAPGFFTNVGYGAGMGVMRGAANLARNVSLLAGGIASAAEASTCPATSASFTAFHG